MKKKKLKKKLKKIEKKVKWLDRYYKQIEFYCDNAIKEFSRNSSINKRILSELIPDFQIRYSQLVPSCSG